MPNAKIQFPQSARLDQILAFARELDYFSQHDRLIIDLPKKFFCPPFAMLLIGSKIAYLRKNYPNLNVIFNGWEAHGYLSHMGFFSMCGYQHGKEVGEAKGNDRYLPITKLSANDLVEGPSDKYQEMQDLLQRQVDRISLALAHDKYENSALFDVLSYCLREVFRNTFEHGEADELFYCAQYWPTTNKVEFAASDFGIGVRKGLGRNPNFRFKEDKTALEYALLPSVSGRTHEPKVSETWFNSGYGLYMTNRLARNGGNFPICSGSSAICLSPKTKYNFRTSFPGTILRVKLDVDKIGSIQDRLSEFRLEGKQIAASIAGSGNRPPSAMSMLLRRDYAASQRRKR